MTSDAELGRRERLKLRERQTNKGPTLDSWLLSARVRRRSSGGMPIGHVASQSLRASRDRSAKGPCGQVPLQPFVSSVRCASSARRPPDRWQHAGLGSFVVPLISNSNFSCAMRRPNQLIKSKPPSLLTNRKRPPQRNAPPQNAHMATLAGSVASCQMVRQSGGRTQSGRRPRGSAGGFSYCAWGRLPLSILLLRFCITRAPSNSVVVAPAQSRSLPLSSISRH